MNTSTAIASYVFAFVVAVLIGVVIRRMMRGWKRRSRLQEAAIGTLPAVPVELGAVVVGQSRGLYVGSTIAPNWLDRVSVGDLGYRYKAVLTRYPAGILLERCGTSPIWIPGDSITAIRVEPGLAGKVLPEVKADNPGGILVIRWRLPSGTEIDSGFRGDDRQDYSMWTAHAAGDDEAGGSK